MSLANRFSPQLAHRTKTLRDLLSPKNSWVWDKDQQNAFDKVKEELSSPKTLALYDPSRDTKVSADSSSYGLGGVLLQKIGESWKPVSYASRSLTETETRYAQVEKEALAVTWACERFSDYLIGLEFQIETGHKPLVSLLGRKSLDDLPPRIIRFHLRLMRFNYSVFHVPGKHMYTADTLSQAPLASQGDHKNRLLEQEVQAFVDVVMNCLPATDTKLGEISSAQQEDEICMEIVNYCINGWPQKHEIKGPLKAYETFAHDFSVKHRILMRGDRIVIPAQLRIEMLQKIHAGHQGIVKCRELARSSIWWPSMSKQIEEMVKTCNVCIKHKPETVEPLLPSEFPTHAWQKMGVDLREIKRKMFLVGIDYYSRYLEVIPLSTTTAHAVIEGVKAILARHGVVEKLISDN